MDYIETLVLLTGWIIISVIPAAWGQTCNTAAINACWTPMNNLPEHLTWSSIVPTLGEQEMRQHCQLFDKVETCLNGILSSCPLLDTKAQQGVIEAYKWICDDAFDEYLKHRVCFTNTALHNEGKHCNQSLTTRLDSLDSSQSANYRLQRICQYANDYLDCVENAVKSFCGAEAANWQRKLDTRNIEPIMSLANCKLDNSGKVYYASGDHTKTYIIIGVIVALTVVLILLTVVMLILFKRKKSRLRQNACRNEHAVVGYSANGDIATANIQPGIQHNQAGPLPQKTSEPPPYEPYLVQPHLNGGPYTSLNAEGAVAASTLSSPPPYEEDIKKVPPIDNNNTDYSQSYGTNSHLGMDNPVYKDYVNNNE